MAIQDATNNSNDKAGRSDETFSATVAVAGALTGSSEGIVMLPYAENGWKLSNVVLACGVNTTHSTSGLVTATVELNTDGGTSALSTDPSVDDSATGRVHSSDGVAGSTAAVIDGDNDDFPAYSTAFVTISETGSGGADPSDVSVHLEFTRQADFDPDYTVE